MSEAFPEFKNNFPLEKIYQYTREFYDETCEQIKQPFWNNKLMVVNNLSQIVTLLGKYKPAKNDKIDSYFRKAEKYIQALPLENPILTRQLFNENGFVDEIIFFRKTFELLINNPHISPTDKEKLYTDTVDYINKIVEIN